LLPSKGTLEILATTSMPDKTFPKIEYLLSRTGWGARQMKNEVSALSAHRL
jgi:hypothetical protein